MARHAFSRELRLLTPAQFKNVFDNPVRAASPHLTLLAKPNGLEHPRLGLAVPKKALKRAVWRNRVKRVARESFRLKQHKLPSVDIVVIAKKGIGDVPNDELFELMERLWRTLSRRCKDSA
ncbi:MULTISPECIES: ribonuclease P protein component [Oceanimonas]|uniref:Ribonuclease P protein component n=1 Tax=Oceanimonas doudoroffii TaxID=84158 RepID=A0A233RAX5_9GAMM|nr:MULTISPECIES: ribonuclease P protein component [Oceanimonas]NHI02130.1 Ribonuclease P protein component [Oceanimonas sp. MB9]OXY80545.1 ribonuclease P protein component [Oceanimonas doudoroffii]